MGLEYTPYTPYKRYKLEISYDGSDYCGWQIQPHSPSVQQTLQETLEKLYKHPIHLIGHIIYFACHQYSVEERQFDLRVIDCSDDEGTVKIGSDYMRLP